MTRGMIIVRDDRDTLMRVAEIPLAAISDTPRQDRDLGDIDALAK